MRLSTVALSQKSILWNILQKYLYEMTAFYGDAIGADGDYPYVYFDCYFDPAMQNERFAEFIYDGNVLAGFAMVNTHSFNGKPVDHCLAEFAVFPAYRGSGLAEAAVHALVKKYSGKWQLKYLPKNMRGMKFWQKIMRYYGGNEEPLGDEMLVSLET